MQASVQSGHKYSPTRESAFKFNANTLSFSLDRPLFFSSKHKQKIIDGEEINYPFKPQIHDLPLNLYKERSKLQISKEQQLERLLSNRLEQQEKRKREKLKIQEIQIKNHCTFQPQISNTVQLENETEEEVHERLYKQGLEKAKIKQMAQPEQEKYPFKPTINKVNFSNAEKGNLQPLYLRIREEMRKQQERKAMLKQKKIQQQQEKCVPFQVNPKSQEIIEKKDNFCKNVVERLMKDLKEKQQRKQILIQKQEIKEKQLHPFVPEVNPMSSNLSISFKEDFLQRQYILGEELKEKMQIRMQQILKQEATFKPQINKLSAFLINLQRHNQTDKSRIERLHQDFDIKKKENIRQIQNQTYKQCTFQPQINHISKALDADPKHHCCERPTCTEYNFTPVINTKSRQIAKNALKKSDNSEANLQKVKMELEYNEMKQCTFKPRINNAVSKSQRNLNQVNGINNFLKITEIKKKKVEEQKKIEEKIFHLQKKYDERPEKNTKINQFKLSKPNAKTAKELRQEQLQNLAKQCPFKPNTNKSRDRALIHRIIY